MSFFHLFMPFDDYEKTKICYIESLKFSNNYRNSLTKLDNPLRGQGEDD
jgi:hypothetical protein